MLTNKPLQEEVVFEEVSEQAGHSYCGPAGGYEDIAECRKNRTERQPVPAIVLGLMFNKERVHIQCHQRRQVTCVHPYCGRQAVRIRRVLKTNKNIFATRTYTVMKGGINQR